MNKKNILELLRNRINYIDQKIIVLLSQRQSLSIDIANKKIRYGLKIRDSIRENLLLKKLYTICIKNNINYQYIIKIFNIIIDDSVKIQKEWTNVFNQLNTNKKKLCCAVLGPQGSYSNLTFNTLLKQKNFFLKEYECSTFSSIMDNLNNNICQFALLPIKNSIAGIIPETYEILQKKNLYIIKEIYVNIKHSLLVLKGTYFSEINKIYTHIQPFQQCKKFIKNFTHWKINYTNSSANAMKKISLKKDNTLAAIGHKIGGKIYKLQEIAKNLSNSSDNITRFILLSTKLNKNIQNQKSKTTFFVKFIKQNININEIINIFKKQNLEVTNITWTFDIKNKDKKIYYFDINTIIDNQLLFHYLKKIQKNIYCINILGSYPIENNAINIE
ncbi:chorismate mutase [Buchnera aphidicola (Cinara tujafilina)]|uniref:Bifunctional chorismate mutase/prephenate dehydratase n=1 Tax=Buchnera aphidicola (Cinara tujafilina) TaxID=261317 RepID=F7WZH5_9GAMM|nr:prephenate dehydratase domain-containing protein [Buchnera aphidicola]AEH39838.1 chorismate mutase [Buchnera aphidicola (Cinara tujafilina)]